MSANPTRNSEGNSRNRQPTYNINEVNDDTFSEQGLSRNDNRYTFASDNNRTNDRTAKNSQEVTLDSDDDELMFDKEALNANRDSNSYQSMKHRKSKDMTNPSDTIFELLEEEDELATLDFLRTHFVDLTQLRDARGYTVLHIVAYKGLESM